MATPYNSKYLDSKYVNPGDDVDPKIKRGVATGETQAEKQYNWFLQKCEYIYAAYLRDDAFIPYSGVRDYRLNRLYAQGMQPNTKYMDRLTLKDKATNLRKGWMNISWDILPILPKFRSLVLGKFEDIDYSIQVRAIDDASNTVREDSKMAVMVEQKYGEILKEIRTAIGLPAEAQAQQDAKLPFIPKSLEEFEMMGQMGAFKLQWEVSMDKLLNDTAARNNWPELKRRLMEDAVDIGVIAVKDYHDPQTRKPMCRYVDPEYLIIRQTRRNDYFDVSEAGEICWYTLEQLKSMGLDDTQLRVAANAYNAMWGNSFVDPNRVSGNFDRSQYDSFRIAVLDTEFTSMDREYYESRIIGGREVAFDLPYDSPAVTGSNKKNKLIKSSKPKYYRAKWVIGTDIVFDYGMQYDVPYDQQNNPRSSFTCYRVSDRSMINQCIASADDVQITVLKFRNAVAESKPPGLMIEWGSLSQISLGGEKLDPFDILKIYRDRGDLLFKYAINPQNGQPVQGAIPPVSELKGGIGPYLNELIGTLDWHLNIIREITGLNAVVDASTPAPKALVGTAKIAEQGTNNVLRPILSGYKSVKSRAFANLCNRWQITGMFYSDDVVVGGANAAFETIKVGAELYKPVFDVYCDALISDEDKMKLDQACLESLRAAKTGSIGITMMDYFYIQQLIAAGNIRWAWVYLSYRENILQQQQQQSAQQTQQVASQMAQQQDQNKAAAEERKIIIAEKAKQETLRIEYKLKAELEIVKAREKRKEGAQAPAPKQESQPA